MKYRVKIEPSALRDLEALADELAEHGGDAWQKWFDRLAEHVLSLDTFPNRCPLAVDESAHWGRTIRCLHFGRKPHVRRILFEVDGPNVHVLHVTHGARDR